MNRPGPLLSATIIFLALLIHSGLAFAQGVDALETVPKRYSKDYVFVTMPYEKPYGKTRSIYRNETVGIGVRYAHRLDSEWVVGLKFERKPLIRLNDQPLNLLVLSNQTQAIFRLYHPLYILAGTEVSYILPTQRSTPPFVKDPDLGAEIGAGLNVSLWWLTSRKGAVELHLSRWKGTKTNNLEGLESSIGYGVGF